MKVFFGIILSTMMASCSLVIANKEHRELQTKIIQKISDKSSQFQKCAQKHKIHEHFKRNRVKTSMILTINHKGLVDKFRLDEKLYPEKFANCMFKVVDIIIFPKFKEGDLVNITQPFTFLKE